MTHSEYERHVLGQLCRHCHEATRPSHLLQRRCPSCLAKWSYRGRRIEWELIKAFALGATAHRAAQVVGCSYPTAAQLFMECRQAMNEWTVAERGDLLEALGLKEQTTSRGSKSKARRDEAMKSATIGVIERNKMVFAFVVLNSREVLLEAIQASGHAGIVLHAHVFQGVTDLKYYRGSGTGSPSDKRRARNDRVEAFWRFATGQIRWQAHGIAPENIVVYLGEFAYRFNHSGEPLVDRLFSVIVEPWLPNT